MKKIILMLAVILNFINILSAENQFYIKPNSSWVQKVKYDPDSNLCKDNKKDGGIYLLIDFQQNLAFQESFKHFVIKIDEESGIQNYSDIWIDYNPAYEQLLFHKLIIHRKGKQLNRLESKNFKIIQNETELERRIYSGNYSAGINIENVQVGDIIEYSYTIKGENPIFKGKYFDWFNLEYSIPINKFFLQVTYPACRQINYKLIETSLQPEKSVKDNQVILKWEQNNVPEIVLNSELPSWYIAFGRVQFSEFKSWSDVINWSKPLYPHVDIKNTPLEIKFNELTRGQLNEAEKINKLIQFVQNEVRYVGIEVNEYSHKPRNPIDVYAKRFGDCKDKSYLLVTLLKHLGIEASPAYVNTDLKQNINLLLPSPTNFNHVIVSFKYNEETYFIDATIAGQKGSFENVYNGNYQSALILSEHYNEPVKVSLNSIEKIVFQECIDASDTDKPAKYSVVTTYYGSEADQVRSSFKNQTLKTLESSYLNFYSHIYPDMRVVEDFVIEDNEKKNIIKVYEEYEIDRFWVYNESSSVNDYVGQVSATNLKYYLKVPTQKNRKMPFCTYYPIEIENTIKFMIGKNIAIKKEKGKISNPNFNFTYNMHSEGNIVVLDYTYKTLKDFVSVDELGQYYQDADKVANLIWNEFIFGKSGDRGFWSSLNLVMIFLLIFFIIVLIFFAAKLYKMDIEVTRVRENSLPIGGWLVLPVIGVIFSPFTILYSLISGDYFSQAGWNFISSSDSAGYDIIWSVTFLVELFGNSFMLVYAIFIIILLIKKRTIFPNHYIAIRALDLFFVILHALLTSQINSEYYVEEIVDYNNIGKAAMSALIWIPYMIFSLRVKDTFVNKFENTDIKE